ncbi:hypothetical protein SAMN02949497_3556 [Methylomagnum ishizawai]|uniref:Uncharacterized protein n=1 Tax=Methylomagnum ishizawai TaxID=1760988 RepID=A0A1Y6D0P4_9GAMM|nr:hypothetical protein [Methylomagnum ishizawai]SMF96171.1 hypothetical protein SAMN02949497_3556 [Methylomagnum ishizawai]
MIEKTLYTAGYGAGWTLSALDDVLRERNAILLDTRLNPWSRIPTWRKDSIKGHLGELRYAHVKGFGNLNYQGGPIKLADPHPLPFLPLTGRLGLFNVDEADLAPIAQPLAAMDFQEAT